ncbi:hypothetical protein [Blastopirellula marina]|uniref:hypothetical protein n=1 Tax=Blastopirellula marina TaxID=124 RepID=UPI0011B003FB|nr:hypothetical protein [Blastopirellula marina]
MILIAVFVFVGLGGVTFWAARESQRGKTIDRWNGRLGSDSSIAEKRSRVLNQIEEFSWFDHAKLVDVSQYLNRSGVREINLIWISWDPTSVTGILLENGPSSQVYLFSDEEKAELFDRASNGIVFEAAIDAAKLSEISNLSNCEVQILGRNKTPISRAMRLVVEPEHE